MKEYEKDETFMRLSQGMPADIDKEEFYKRYKEKEQEQKDNKDNRVYVSEEQIQQLRDVGCTVIVEDEPSLN